MKGILAALLVAVLLALASLGSGCGKVVEKKKSENVSIFDEAPLKKVTVEDIDIAYKEFGEGEPLVMITGYSATMDIWDPTFLESLAASFHVFVFDNRGMGETTSGNKEWTIDQFAADTAGFIQALGFDKANVLGWSLGGDVALSLVVYFPENVIKLVSYAGDCGGSEKVNAPEYKDVLKDYEDVNAPLNKFFASLFPPEWMEANPLFIKDFPIPKEHSSPKSIALQDKAYYEWDGVYEFMPEVRTPLLAATGTEDVSTPPENAMTIVNRVPGAWLARFSGGGHGLQYQYPVQFAQVITTFLKSP